MKNIVGTGRYNFTWVVLWIIPLFLVQISCHQRKNQDGAMKNEDNAMMQDSFSNPVIPGFNPDPCILRVDKDYYIVTSSFEWFPGIPVYHSLDLVNWQQTGHILTEEKSAQFAGCRQFIRRICAFYSLFKRYLLCFIYHSNRSVSF